MLLLLRWRFCIPYYVVGLALDVALLAVVVSMRTERVTLIFVGVATFLAMDATIPPVMQAHRSAVCI